MSLLRRIDGHRKIHLSQLPPPGERRLKLESHLIGLKEKLASHPFKKRSIPGAILAGVVVPLVLVKGEIELLFVQRSNTLKHHPGQIAFPGGGKETCDGSLLDTALRELKEETNLECVEILGQLNQHFTYISNYLITPYVAYLPSIESIKKDGHEVVGLLPVPLSQLLEPQNKRIENWQWRGKDIPMPFFDCFSGSNPITIWGATGRILEEFLTLF